MSSSADAEKTATQGPVYPRDTIDGQKSYRVILEDISSGIETTDSFAIKFSLLIKTPISKMKHVVRHLPAPIWSGQGRSRAEHILALIEEAGGKGKVVEIGGAPSAAPGEPVKPAKSDSSCRWCGYPLKDEEKRCGFCMTPVGDAAKSELRAEPKISAKALSWKRLLCYAAVLAAGIMVILFLAR